MATNHLAGASIGVLNLAAERLARMADAITEAFAEAAREVESTVRSDLAGPARGRSGGPSAAILRRSFMSRAGRHRVTAPIQSFAPAVAR